MRLFVIIALTMVSVALLEHPMYAVPPAPWEVDELVGQNAPGFTLKDLNDRDVSLEDFRGKVVFINFWATWCPPCKEEIPVINQLYEKYMGKDFVILGISTDDSKKDVARFVEKYKVKFMILHDQDAKIMRKYKGFSLPVSYLIDRQGRITDRFLGAQDWIDENFLQKIDDLI